MSIIDAWLCFVFIPFAAGVLTAFICWSTLRP